MPSKSKKQHNFMEAIAHNKAFAKKVGVPQSVGEDFVKADKGKTFKKGGINMATKKKVNPAMAMMAARAMQEPQAPSAPMAPAAPMAAPGGMKKGGKTKKMATGGATMGPRNMSQDVEAGSNKHGKFGESKLQKRGHTEAKQIKMAGNTIGTGTAKKMAKGGSTSSRADGIAQRGRTNTKYC